MTDYSGAKKTLALEGGAEHDEHSHCVSLVSLIQVCVSFSGGRRKSLLKY